MSARTTLYTITNRRVVMRVGIVLTVTFNLPFRRIEAADIHPLAHGHGDIALTLDRSTRIAYPHLWPHARPWRLQNPQPMLRCVPDGANVAAMLASALKAPPPPQTAAAFAEATARQEPTNKLPSLTPAAA